MGFQQPSQKAPARVIPDQQIAPGLERRSMSVRQRLLAARQVAWALVDQALSSFTNFAIGIIAARELGGREFGAFSIALTVYLFLLWVSRSLSTQPFVIRWSTTAPEARHDGARDATGAAAAIGIAVGMAIVPVAMVSGAALRWVLVALAASLPGLLLQDAYRYVLFNLGRTRAATVNDGIWCGTQLACGFLLVGTGHAGAASLVAAFGLGATVAALVGAKQTDVAPRVSSSWRWTRDHRDLGVPFLIELVMITGMVQLTTFGVAAVAGVAAAGELRAAQLLFGPLTVVFLGVFVVALPAAARLAARSRPELSRMVTGLGVAMPLVTLVWSLGMVLLPAHLGSAVLGVNWAPARHLVVPLGALIGGHGCAIAAVVGLRALGASRRSLRARALAAPAILVGGMAGAELGGVYGAAVGVAIGAWLDAVVTYAAFRSALVEKQGSKSSASQELELLPTEL